MRRTRRHKFILVSVFFLVYSIIQVLSEHSLESLKNADAEEKQEHTSTTTTAVPSSTHASTTTTKSPRTTESTTPKTTTTTGTSSTSKEPTVTTPTSTPESSTFMSTTEMPFSTKPTGHPTWRPKRENCTPPAIEQFPRPLMSHYARAHGGLIIHVIVAIYTFLGLAIVCDEYFVSSLDRICEEVKLAPDVAGATFMAAGSSAPELATVVIGVFFAKDDIGISGVIGSAVFNIMFVISVCALCAGTVSHLNWWPLVRDCFFYAISILVMLFTIIDETVTWAEATFMLCMYVVYCVCLHFNSALESWVTTHVPLPASCVKAPEEESALVSYRTLHEDRTRVPSYSTSPPATTPTVQQPAVESTGLNSWNDDLDHGFGAAPTNFGAAPTNFGAAPTSGPQANQALMPQQQQPPLQIQVPITQDYYKPKSDQERRSPLIKPTEGGYYELYSWAIVYPIHFMCTNTMPDCKSEKYKNWYPFTFFVSMVWISFYSYIMVWMITIIGSTLGIPDTVMGLTFVAAGVSVPDALSSIAVIKEGYGDMAVSNAVGSNVFDILVCLGLPWFIQTAIIKPGSHVNVISKGLTYSTLSLLSTVVFLVVATHLNGWKLDKRYGVILMIWYLIFIIFASMYELNIFGQLNPPECLSYY